MDGVPEGGGFYYSPPVSLNCYSLSICVYSVESGGLI